MHKFNDIVDFFVGTVANLRKDTINLYSPLEEITLKGGIGNLAYTDNRRDAKEKYGIDFWSGLDKNWLTKQAIKRKFLYSKSEQFPDFLFKVRRQIGCGNLSCGSLLELKDSRRGGIASFNSTLPTRYKSLKEIEVINGSHLVSRIASIMDKNLASIKGYYTFQRRCFYLIRTYRDSKKVKISIVDGSFFETVPKEHLIYQVFLNVLQKHLQKKEVILSDEIIKHAEIAFSHITDQTIISSSQIIESASVRPRLRIMAEVHPEGNPHESRFYPQISEKSFNFIIQASPSIKGLEDELYREIPELNIFSIYHKRNGEHKVFQFTPEL